MASQTPGMGGQMHSPWTLFHSVPMKVDDELSYPHLTDASVSINVSELGVSRHSLDASLGPIRTFYQAVQLLKTKLKPKGKGVQRDSFKNKAQAIVKGKGKEQEPSAAAE
ncbi:hypothetical protein C0995_014977 [Termitomyces sp. Mi166|nr:hypothetical protein C0995_014977 [Termitomyces sp. Mi166\